jgi:hypothetical protein
MNLNKKVSANCCHQHCYYSMNLRETRGRREGNNKTDNEKIRWERAKRMKVLQGRAGSAPKSSIKAGNFLTIYTFFKKKLPSMQLFISSSSSLFSSWSDL